MTFWSLIGSGSPEGIYRGKRKVNLWSKFLKLGNQHHFLNFPFWHISGVKIFQHNVPVLTAFSICPEQRKARSCLQWSRRFHFFGDPFQEKKTRLLKNAKQNKKTNKTSKRLQVTMLINFMWPLHFVWGEEEKASEIKVALDLTGRLLWVLWHFFSSSDFFFGWERELACALPFN